MAASSESGGIPIQQCVRIKKNGERCKSHAVAGATVCEKHGGNAEHVRRAAGERLAMALPELVGRLLELTDPNPKDAPKCPFCRRGMPRQAAPLLKAILGAMDRGGLGPHSKVEVEDKNDLAWMDFATAEEMEVIGNIAEVCIARMQDEGFSTEEAVH